MCLREVSYFVLYNVTIFYIPVETKVSEKLPAILLNKNLLKTIRRLSPNQ